jgi:hypothetical protein
MLLIILLLGILAASVILPEAFAQTRTMQFDKVQYTMTDEAFLSVTDYDANRDSNAIDRIGVYISSDSDAKGMMIGLSESDTNSGIFEGRLIFTSGSSGSAAINTKTGGNVRATYYYWQPSGEFCNISTSADIGNESLMGLMFNAEPECVSNPLGYPSVTLSNLQVVRYSVDPVSKSLSVILTDVKEDASVTLTLDRKMIDAKSNDKDVDFTILLDTKIPATFSELSRNETHRMIKIQIPENTQILEIFGTQVLPEFPFNILAIMTIGLFAMLIIFRLRSNSFFGKSL